MLVHLISRRLSAHYIAQSYESLLRRHSGDMATNIVAEFGMSFSSSFDRWAI